MKKIGKLFCLCVLSFVLICCFVSCKADESGRKEFCKNMLSDFTAEVEYTVETDEGQICGTAVITKADVLRIDVLSPEPFSGISIESDGDADSDVISLTYSSVKATLPKNAMEKYVFLMDMMSESTACALDAQKKDRYLLSDCITDGETVDAVPYEVSFSHNGAEYTFIYDSIRGVPLEITAESDSCCGQIKVTDIKIKTE